MVATVRMKHKNLCSDDLHLTVTVMMCSNDEGLMVNLMVSVLMMSV